jgi:putative transposase
MRDELLNETLFFGLGHAREKISAWVSDYNHRRPHSSLGYAPPAEYAANLTAQAIGCATPTSSAERLLLHPRPRTY